MAKTKASMMDLTCATDILQQALAPLANLSKGTIGPADGAVLLDCRDDRLTMTATDHTTFQERRYPGVVQQAPGTALVAAGELYQFVRNLPPGGEVIVRADDTRLHVKADMAEASLPLADPGRFPSAPPVADQSFEAASETLQRAINGVLWSCGPVGSGWAEGLHIDRDGDDLVCSSTDSRAAAEVRDPVAWPDGMTWEGPVTIQAGSAKAIAGALADDVTVTIGLAGNYLMVRTADTTTWCRLVAGNVPPISDLLSPGEHIAMVYDVEDLVRGLNQVQAMGMRLGGDTLFRSRWTFGPSNLAIWAYSQSGEAEAIIPYVEKPEEFEKLLRAYQPKFVAKALKAGGSPSCEVVIKVPKDPVKPMVLEAQEDAGIYWRACVQGMRMDDQEGAS